MLLLLLFLFFYFFCGQVRSQLSKNDRKKFNTVLIVDVHNRDIVDRFVRDRYGDTDILGFVFLTHYTCGYLCTV